MQGAFGMQGAHRVRVGGGSGCRGGLLGLQGRCVWGAGGVCGVQGGYAGSVGRAGGWSIPRRCHGSRSRLRFLHPRGPAQPDPPAPSPTLRGVIVRSAE